MSKCRKADKRPRGIRFSCQLPSGHEGDCRAVVLYSVPVAECEDPTCPNPLSHSPQGPHERRAR